ncbi:Zinc finger protein MSN2 [Fusarium austroafricanum]|uniref:Zinc finger protein MSN2 n=1 Tax=Fusarium austroafricanum TaxID=2364996 RepID=A0A8H4NYV2_9HYPO|nr:Zinc finger protein MSN2 [Fusarium austroafricanum]
MEGWPQIDDLLFASGTLDSNPELTSDDWNSLPLNTSYHTNDAAFADVHLGTYTDTNNTNLFDTYTYPINPNLYDLDELPALDYTYPDISPINWDFMMPTTMDDPPTSITTMASSCNTTEPSDYAPTYITSPTSMAQSPTGLSQPQVSEKLTENDADKTASTKTRRRRTKMKAGTRPCDLK